MNDIEKKNSEEFFALTRLCSDIHTKMCEVHDKTPESCYISYKNQLWFLLKKMDTSIESFNKGEEKIK